MNKDFRKTLDARLSGMRWGEREQDGVLQRIRQEKTPCKVPAQRRMAPLMAALAALMIIAGSVLTLRILPSPAPQLPMTAIEEEFEQILSTAEPADASLLSGKAMNLHGPTFETERLTLGILDASCTAEGAWAQLCIQPSEGSAARLIVATDEARAASSPPQDLHVTLRMATIGQGSEMLPWQGTPELAFNGYAEVRFVTEEIPVPEGLPILLTVEVQDENGTVLETTEHRFRLFQEDAADMKQ